MLTLDLLRHGALEGGVRYRGLVDDPLTDEGRREMDRVWRRLRGDVDTIVASPLRRCAGPAREWAAEAGIECIEEPRLSELHYGEWEGMSAEEIRQRWPGMLERWRRNPAGMRPPGGEAPEALRERVRAWWEGSLRTETSRHLLVVAHSGSLRMLIAIALGGDIAMTRRIAMPYACWSRLRFSDGRAWLEFHNRLPERNE